ncbi:MAG: hypothetical protein DRQ40_09495 [Gammaproteobacteria bacterium]|nr:MAG: hypothetical protein DRQ40_09495 [Gammaproteobacteria bacterium]
MAIIFSDGFDAYGDTIGGDLSPTGVMGARGWSADAHKVASGRIDGYSVFLRSYDRISLNLDNKEATKIVGCAFYLTKDTDIYGGLTLFELRDLGITQMAVKLNSGKRLEVYTGTGLIGTTSQTFDLDAWYYIEFASTIHYTEGSYELMADGLTLLSDSNIRTQWSPNSYWEHLSMGLGLVPYYVCKIDDFYIADSTGTHNNDFLGPIHIETLFPDGDETSQWSASSGADHYALVDENPANDTTYLEDGVSGQRELFDFPEAGSYTTGILAVRTVARVGATDAEIMEIKPVVTSGSTTDTDPNAIIVAASPELVTKVYETDPDTSAPWTLSGFDSAQFGFEVA